MGLMTWQSWTAIICGLGLALLTYAVMLVQIPGDLERMRQAEINELERLYAGK